MNITDFLLNFRQTYKSGKTEEGEKDLNEETLRREFDFYPPDKLEKVWQAVRRHHKATWYPIIGQVLDCMDKAGVNETSRQGKKETYFNRCMNCGCNYSLKARNCPDCNRALPDGEFFINDVEIVKADTFLSNHVSCNEGCPICPTFKSNRNVRGAKCRGWNTEDREKYNCETCPCKFCCEMKGRHDEQHPTGELFKFCKTSSENDTYWIKYYNNMEIKKDMIIKYTGNHYKNLTGEFKGQSPKKDIVNWKYFIPKKMVEKTVEPDKTIDII